MTRMSKLNSQVLAVLLVTLIAAISMAQQEDPLMLAPAARPAGCHQHGAKLPAPGPVSYRCCQSGHDSAILQTSLAAQLSSALLATSHAMPFPITIPTQVWVRRLKISSPDPPHLVPLRI